MIKSRVGLFMKKVGCTHVYRGETAIPVTLLSMCANHIVGFKTIERDGYNSVVLGYGDFRSVNKPQLEISRKAGVDMAHKLFEYRVDSLADYQIGDRIGYKHFVAGQYVDVSGISIGKGFAGGMKRHGFSGMGASHGVSLSHRVLGSTGQCQDPGKVNKGKKMPGRMGFRRNKLFNFEVISVDLELGLLVVRGNSVPGHKHGWVLVEDAARKALPITAPTPYDRFTSESKLENVVEGVK